MVHSKLSSDSAPPEQVPEDEFMQIARSLGLSTWKNANTGIFTDPVTQRAYKAWKGGQNA